jgi:hypothetical protein
MTLLLEARFRQPSCAVRCVRDPGGFALPSYTITGDTTRVPAGTDLYFKQLVRRRDRHCESKRAGDREGRSYGIDIE